MPDIKCNVAECDYNNEVKCNAPMIQVNRNHTSKSKDSEHTMCETFRPTDS
ncbi:MAG: DUF1540 domain-containing protein [Eubacteriales bacterium]|nr:DUF1540 domain-containing protein [Bacillota bacterium]MBV1727592.1 DUF1540 domain-containing protein [Desulforudis sp.]MDQ7789723.1 DUF1540 domain-containing protein [Clostridia bacterium]MDZ4043359.1 DUF1540 domain-containing protein [Eubacteriales bacterium]MBU4532837.1 DUF1540 domain-containing protein [Bacillota bacterium]